MTKEKTTISVENAEEQLSNLAEAFAELKKQDNEKINVFTAAGMTNQEIKHSAFLGWLFDCNKPHKLQNTFLKKFLQELLIHTNKIELKNNQRTNAEILNTLNINSIEDLQDFIDDNDYKVFTELATLDGTGRMDIVVESEKTKTVLVIENKTFTTTHDCQLSKYEEHYRNSKFERKLFVFLTPKNDLPIDIDDKTHEYRPNWCVFDYDAVIKIVKQLIPTANSENNRKLKYIMEDYIDMVNTHLLLKNKNIQDKCKQIRNAYGDILELLNAYSSFDNVIDFCTDYIKEHYQTAHIVKTKVAFMVYTDAMIKFFNSFGEDITTDNSVLKCRAMCQVSFTGNRSTNYFSIERVSPHDWSPAQERIKDIFGDESTKERMHKWVWSIPGYKVQIVDRDFESYPFEELKMKLPLSLNKFINDLKLFDSKLLANLNI